VFDKRTLELLDSDNDGRIRASELIAAVEWLKLRLKSLDVVFNKDGAKNTLAFDAINDETQEGRELLESLKKIAVQSGNGEACEVTLSDVVSIGKVFSGTCAQTMILCFNVTHILNIGVGGSLSEKLNICDLGIATGVVQHDMDTSPLGDPLGLISGINIIKFPCDEKNVLLIEQAAKNLGINSLKGVIASGDSFVASNDKKDFIKKNFDGIVCEMEGGAIGQVCYINKVPFNVIRAVSDNADGSADMDFPQFTKKAVEQSMILLKEYIKIKEEM
jgi:adenosylhomocysteine nucleosidase